MQKIKNLNDVPAIAQYLTRIGALPRSLRTAVVIERRGDYHEDIAVIKFLPDGKVNAPDAFRPTENEADAIKVSMGQYQWPSARTIPQKAALPATLASADPADIFTFKDLNGEVLMMQHRRELKGEKSYVPWTYWDDEEWRTMEPEGLLPLWGLDQLNKHQVVFIHEGAKAASRVRWMVEAATPEARAALSAHPWGEELAHAAHLGWIGGALSPSRTDWSILSKTGVKRAYIVSDNDIPGVAAVPAIARHLRFPTFQIQFTSEWPSGFDLADEFPAKMFKSVDGERYYVGPSFRSCLHPATWATDLIPNPKGKPSVVLRKNFKDMWSYVEEADLFVCIDMPEILRSENIMNKMLSAFSDTNRTSELLVKAYTGRSAKLCYRPDNPGRIITDVTTSAINLHTATHVKSKPGNPAPFIEFLEYMFPNEAERYEVAKWCATMIAQPAVRMEYGLLLVSERQGVGKSTLGASILAPLVGTQNTGYPTEAQIVQSEFNGWLANKRLVIIHEIYSGHSWKAYNKLKSAITDKEVEVNEKYQRTYTIENWAHVFACSNSLRALKMEEDDRRWFYPEVTEEKWTRNQFEDFHNWLRSGGLSIIKHWAENFGDYVQRGMAAPMTARKKELIIESRTEGQQEAVELAQAMLRTNKPMVMAMKEIVEFVRQSVQGRMYDSDNEIRKAMKEGGALWTEDRFLIKGRIQHAALNEPAMKTLRKEGFEMKSVKGGVGLQKPIEETEEWKDRRRQFYDRLRAMAVDPSSVVGPAM